MCVRISGIMMDFIYFYSERKFFDYSRFLIRLSMVLKNTIYPERLLEITLARNVANAAISLSMRSRNLVIDTERNLP